MSDPIAAGIFAGAEFHSPVEPTFAPGLERRLCGVGDLDLHRTIFGRRHGRTGGTAKCPQRTEQVLDEIVDGVLDARRLSAPVLGPEIAQHELANRQ